MFTLLGGALALAGGCSAPAGGDADGIATGKSKTIRLVHVEWADCTAATHVVQAVLEAQGYKVEALPVSGAAMYSAIAQGDADATVCAWLPSTHEGYYARTRDKLENLGANMEGTKIGLVVPDYVTIDSMDQLASHAGKFKDRIIGIDPGAGEMRIAQQAIEEYALPLKLIDGSDATMAAALKDAIDHREWVVVTGWTPHWMWARWPLKYLDDPKGVFGAPESIDTLVRKGFAQERPEAARILDAFAWTAADMQQVMDADSVQGSDPAANARAWVEAHADQVQSWLAPATAP
ncbi:ABC transporter periplasmic protein [uncultured Stenotrophomonas sp.]|uniref:ABC transporter periplasmic protein n=1 Tax=uncultured Stenotrophomonas sp. TaxID=165438 RepID=A0A1Y5Q302_9GAMM|nr:ABC transporter periplasmic protein [uncultured Stenotrophomonas sp.]